MSDPATLVALASAGTAAIGIASAAGLKGWQDWLELRRAELREKAPRRDGGAPELVELKDRVRQLELIASGRA